MLVQKIHERESVHDVVRLDRLDGRVRRLGGLQLLRVEREFFAQIENVFIEVAGVVQLAFELVAEERAEFLSVPNSFDQPQRMANAFR